MKFFRYAIIVLMLMLAIGLGSCGGGNGELSSITITSADNFVISYGTTPKNQIQLTVTAALSDGSTWPNWPLVDWSSSNNNVTIDTNGWATANVSPAGTPYTSTIKAVAQGHPALISTATLTVQ